MSFEQLDLPIAGLIPQPEPTRIPRTRRVFVNRNLKMAGIDWVGFDMDYTLAIYNQGEMDRLSIQATVDKLVTRGYPEELIRGIDYKIEFPIRGLLIDKRYGHILKMDRFKVVQKGYHGLRELSRDEVRALYQQKKIRPTTARYHWIDTLYALSEATMYTGIVDAYERQGLELDFARLFTDIRECIDEAHRDGTILDEVNRDLPRFVERDPMLAQTLHKLRSAGKKLFLLTNSRWPYTEKMMTYLLGGAMPEYPSFRHYFDVIIVAAAKPAFFQESRPLMRREGNELRPASLPLERGAIYEGGNLHDFEAAIGVTGDRILYVGDHIYGDILRSKKESAWRTAMIIQEMEAEVVAHEACRDQHKKSSELEQRREELEDQLRFYQQRYKDLTRKIDEEAGKNGGEAGKANGAPRVTNGAAETDRARVKRTVERIRGQLRAVDAEANALEREIAQRFHAYWGSLLKEAHETSSFGDQVEEYACVYTSRVSNLLSYSPLQYFRSPRDLLPHEL
ncbi:HAD superfamily (Subfamily IG) hydrolase, 5'-Nucleotidase [Minicystis rosea]|nr:HAD superfamily (Subfamily IG) hydrolase, 5'-Nucleotidase [Minicystis rosea]